MASQGAPVERSRFLGEASDWLGDLGKHGGESEDSSWAHGLAL